MPVKTYYLDVAKTDAVALKWGMFWKNLTVNKDGQILGQVPTRSQLKQGASFELPDGRVLTVRLRSQFGQEELELLLDGQPLPGSATHPHHQFRQALYVLLFVAAFNIILGLIAELGQVAVFSRLGLGYSTVAFGVLNLGLAWWAKAKTAALPLYIGMGILVLDVVLSLAALGDSEGSTPSVAGLFMRFFFLTALFKGAAATKQLKAEQATDLEPAM